METELEKNLRYILMHIGDARRLLMESGIDPWRSEAMRLEIMMDVIAGTITIENVLRKGENQR